MNQFQHPQLLIRASAGTGKTFQLSNRFLRLLCQDVRVDQILATTFTRKAAGEILERVLLRLAKAVQDPQQCQRLSKEIETELSLTDARRMLTSLVHQLHRVRIGTIDSVFVQIARCYALELQLPPGWTICDELQEFVLRGRAIHKLLAAQDGHDLMTILRMLAKGETNRSVSRLVDDTVLQAYPYFQEARPTAWNVLPEPTTVNDEIWQEQLEQLRALADDFPKLAKPIGADFLRAQGEEWEGLFKFGLGKSLTSGDGTYRRRPIEAEVADAYQPILKYARAQLIRQLIFRTQAAADLLSAYEEQILDTKQQRRLLGFADLTQALGDHVDTAGMDMQKLAFRLDAQIHHLLLDEFQDTSPVQWRIIRQLVAGRSADEQDGNKSFFCVGDEKQAIYGWRGGVAEIFDAIPAEIDNLVEAPLTTSYRSCQPVIDVVNQVFREMMGQPDLDRYAEPIENWCERFPPHTTARSDLDGYVTVEVAPRETETADADRQVRHYAAQRVGELQQQHPGCSIGVLVRTNAAVAEMMYLLRREGIAASEEGGNSLADSAAVLQVRSLLELADHPGHTAARFHVAHGPLGPIVGLTDYQNLEVAQQLSNRVRRQLLEEGYGPTIAGYARELVKVAGPRDARRLEQLVTLAYQYESSATLRTKDFIAVIDQRRVPDPRNVDVRVMTIHQAKGLQFDIVVLPELEKKLAGRPEPFVSRRPEPAANIDCVMSFANQDVVALLPAEIQQMFTASFRGQVSETLCVLYVALTRAIHGLHMILAPSKPNERTIPKTWAGLLRSALVSDERLEPSTRPFEHGSVEWTAPEELEPTTAAEADEPTQPLRLELAATPAISRVLPRVRPSGLEGGGKVSVAELLGGGSPVGRQFGTAIHAWFEQIEWLPSAQVNREHLRQVALQQCGIFDEPLIEKWIDRFLKYLEQPNVTKVLSPEFYASERLSGLANEIADRVRQPGIQYEVYHERPVIVRVPDGIVNGFVDRLVLMRSGKQVIAADIVDFKTDTIKGDDAPSLRDKTEYYRPQQEQYRQAIAANYRLHPDAVTWRLLFLSVDRVVGRGDSIDQADSVLEPKPNKRSLAG